MNFSYEESLIIFKENIVVRTHLFVWWSAACIWLLIYFFFAWFFSIHIYSVVVAIAITWALEARLLRRHCALIASKAHA